MPTYPAVNPHSPLAKRCECCNELAMNLVTDLKETTVVLVDRWRTWTIDSNHYFCKQHTRKPYLYSDNPPLRPLPSKPVEKPLTEEQVKELRFTEKITAAKNDERSVAEILTSLGVKEEDLPTVNTTKRRRSKV